MSRSLQQLGWPERAQQPVEPKPEAPAVVAKSPVPQHPPPVIVAKPKPELAVPSWLLAIAIGCALVTPLLMVMTLWQVGQLRTSMQLMAHFGHSPYGMPRTTQ